MSLAGVPYLPPRAPWFVIGASPRSGRGWITSTEGGHAGEIPEPSSRCSETTAGSPMADAAPRPADDESPVVSTRSAISELRLLSGLTWDQLGELFGVSRRSVHYWVSGQALNREHERHVREVLDIVKVADRGSAQANRAMLSEVREGRSGLALLAAKDFSAARNHLGKGPGRRRVVMKPLSAENRAARAPLPPEVMLNALQDSVHRDVGVARPAKAWRVT